jgi:outer membrane protein assembly factor BamB
VTYFTGSVTITVGSNTRSADLGQEVPVDATVSTGDNSQCDLQFGSLGTLRVQADTKVSLDQISVGAERRISSMKLLEGAVAAKVSKLAGSDRFNVTTNSVVCGVRGTEFIVRTAGDGGTTVSVKEGRVALLPPAFDPAPLESGAAGTSAAPLVDKAFSTLQEMVPAVGASQTVTVGAHDLDKASDAWKKVETKLNDLTAKTQAAGDRGAQTPTSPGDTAAALDAAGLKTTIASVASASETLAAKTETVTTAKAHELDAFDTMTILAILGPSQAAAGSGTTSGGTSQAPTEPAAALLVPISITCEPTDAEILVEGKGVGIGTAFMLEPQGSVIHLLVNRGGYESYQEEIHAEAKTGEKRTVVLKAITSSEMSASTSASVASLQQSEPKALPVFARFTVGGGTPIGTALSAEGGAVFLDAQGYVYRVTPKGLAWKTATGNSFSSNACPVLTQDMVYVAGDKNISILSLADGSLRTTVALEKDTFAIFGQRPAISGGEIFVGCSSGFEALDAASGKQRRTMAIPNGSEMTPAVVDGSLVVAQPDGHLVRIDAVSGKELFSVPSPALQPVALAPTVANGRVYFADRKGLVVAADLASGAILWAKSADPSVKSIFDDLLVVGGSVWGYSRGTIFALSAGSGERIMAAIAGAAAPPFAAQGSVWAPMKDGSLVAHDPVTGESTKSLKIDGHFAARPAEANGLFICPLVSGEVVTLNPAAAK